MFHLSLVPLTSTSREGEKSPYRSGRGRASIPLQSVRTLGRAPVCPTVLVVASKAGSSFAISVEVIVAVKPSLQLDLHPLI